MLYFIVGIFVGVSLGIGIMSILFAAKECDRQSEIEFRKDKK